MANPLSVAQARENRQLARRTMNLALNALGLEVPSSIRESIHGYYDAVLLADDELHSAERGHSAAIVKSKTT